MRKKKEDKKKNRMITRIFVVISNNVFLTELNLYFIEFWQPLALIFSYLEIRYLLN